MELKLEAAIEPLENGQPFNESSMSTPPRAAPPQPKGPLEALEQRMAMYKEAYTQARASRDDHKARMQKRIAKQYQSTVPVHKARRAIHFAHSTRKQYMKVALQAKQKDDLEQDRHFLHILKVYEMYKLHQAILHLGNITETINYTLPILTHSYRGKQDVPGTHRDGGDHCESVESTSPSRNKLRAIKPPSSRTPAAQVCATCFSVWSEYNQSFTLTINRNHRGFWRVSQSKGLKLEVLHKG
ncbi:hypothetical protein AAFF_G00001020 [Aldrovandia affinis]|uniref:DM14 domain-containing protein n=1 Tax=Aldrovandia affinis TaxID=143900 RepID=A0AAD7X3C5_9TELE|nr:hypothetical protein AAFF_G00001020 [Aldrovandia affinis]